MTRLSNRLGLSTFHDRPCQKRHFRVQCQNNQSDVNNFKLIMELAYMRHPCDDIAKLLLSEDSIELDWKLLHPNWGLQTSAALCCGRVAVVVFGNGRKVTVLVQCSLGIHTEHGREWGVVIRVCHGQYRSRYSTTWWAFRWSNKMWDGERTTFCQCDGVPFVLCWLQHFWQQKDTRSCLKNFRLFSILYSC